MKTKASSLKIVVKNPGLQVEIQGNLDDVAHGLAHAMNQNPDIKKMIAHAIMVAMDEEDEHDLTNKDLKEMGLTTPEEDKDKIIN